tara:strand:- start:464 stop:655 length:192 start_codon:yes stop_codon:yes gene_type:complete
MMNKYEKMANDIINVQIGELGKISEMKKDIKWFRDFARFVSTMDADMYRKAEKYADEIEEGCI